MRPLCNKPSRGAYTRSQLRKRMKFLCVCVVCVCVVLGASVLAPAQQSDGRSDRGGNVMVVAAERDTNVNASGTTYGELLEKGKVAVSPLAWLTPTGEWKPIECDDDHADACKNFDREYLKKPHTYSVISADGRGATVKVETMKLAPQDDPDSCFGYGGDGTYSGAPIAYATVAASSAELFTAGALPKRLSEAEADPIRKALASSYWEKLEEAVWVDWRTGGAKFESTLDLTISSIRVNGEELFIVKRDSEEERTDLNNRKYELEPVFAVGRMDQGRFDLLYWQKVEGDENERLLGVIYLRNRRTYLVDTVSDPEGQHFRVYGIHHGKVNLAFEGGGGGC